MSLAADFVVRRPEHTTTFALDAAPGEVVAVVGPNGAGKTTALRAIAGLQPITSGSIRLGGRVVSDSSSHLAAHRRDVGFVFSDHLLFPHLDAVRNVAFGLRRRGMSKDAANATAREWLERLGLAELAARRPRQLSGGQAQRVAIARALACRPAVLLLDEPLASLDAGAAMTLRSTLRDHLADFGGVSLLVTHSALDALVVADRLVVLEHGAIVQTGSPTEVAARPRSAHVAALVGLNLISGTAVGGVVRSATGPDLVVSERVDGAVVAVFSPSAVGLYASRPAGSPRNVWSAVVRSVAPHGDAVRVQVDAEIGSILADVTPAALAALDLRVGDPVFASVKATEIAAYPA